MGAMHQRMAIDDARTEARQHVAYLEQLAEVTGDHHIARAAACLDFYQAGISLASPHADTGYVLVPAGDDTERRVIEVALTRRIDLWMAESECGARAFGRSELRALAQLARALLGKRRCHVMLIASGTGHRRQPSRWRIVETQS